MIRVAINGFGRIGRNFLRCLLTRTDSQLDLVAVNDTSDPKTNGHLLKYDSMLGTLKDVDISTDENSITVNGKTIKCVSDRNPLNLPWGDWGIDLIIESKYLALLNLHLFHSSRFALKKSACLLWESEATYIEEIQIKYS